jgi:transcriptional regulator of stress and heat shock response
MSNLADLIEQYLRMVLEQKKIIELQRRDLAKMFRCVPSQINYVLETRFTPEKGFVVESKRGGGGYIRITQIRWRVSEIPLIIENLVPDVVEEKAIEDLLAQLVENELLDADAAQLSFKLMIRDFSDLPECYAGPLRSKFLKALLLVLGSRAKE